MIAISILFPISIPVLAKTNVYRNTGRRIREVHYNQKFKFVDSYVKNKPSLVSKSLSTTIMPSTDLPREVLKLVFTSEVKGLYGEEAVKYLELLRPVCKEWKSLAKEIEIELINSGNITLNDLFSSKDEALTYVKVHKEKLRTLKLLPPLGWKDAEIKTLLLTCPHLERLETEIPISDATFNAILGLKDLTHLRMSSPKNWNLDFTLLSQLTKIKNLDLSDTGVNNGALKTFLASHPNLEELKLSRERDITDVVLIDIGQCQELKSLEIVDCSSIKNYINLDRLPKLQNLRIIDNYDNAILPTLANLPSLLHLTMTFFDIQGDIPSFNSLTQLKTFFISFLGRKRLSLPSFNAMTALQELFIIGEAIDKVPSLDTLVNLKKLRIMSPILSLPSFDALANLEEFSANSLSIKDIPLLPSTLKKLSIEYCKISPPSLAHLYNLEELIIRNCENELPINYLDKLSQLKKLEFSSKVPVDSFPSLDALTKLQVLRLNAKFRSLPALAHLKNLKGLEVRGQVPILNASVKLEVLLVHDLHPLISLPWQQLKDLKALALYSNRHKKLPNELFKHLSNLEILSIDLDLTELPNLDKQQKLKEVFYPNNCRKNLKQLDNRKLKRFQGRSKNFNPLYEALID